MWVLGDLNKLSHDTGLDLERIEQRTGGKEVEMATIDRTEELAVLLWREVEKCGNGLESRQCFVCFKMSDVRLMIMEMIQKVRRKK